MATKRLGVTLVALTLLLLNGCTRFQGEPSETDMRQAVETAMARYPQFPGFQTFTKVRCDLGPTNIESLRGSSTYGCNVSYQLKNGRFRDVVVEFIAAGPLGTWQYVSDPNFFLVQ